MVRTPRETVPKSTAAILRSLVSRRKCTLHIARACSMNYWHLTAIRPLPRLFLLLFLPWWPFLLQIFLLRIFLFLFFPWWLFLLRIFLLRIFLLRIFLLLFLPWWLFLLRIFLLRIFLLRIFLLQIFLLQLLHLIFLFLPFWLNLDGGLTGGVGRGWRGVAQGGCFLLPQGPVGDIGAVHNKGGLTALTGWS